MHRKLSVNSCKAKIMLVKSQIKDKPCIMYNNEPLDTMERFKYLGLEIPSNHRWNECSSANTFLHYRDYSINYYYKRGRKNTSGNLGNVNVTEILSLQRSITKLYLSQSANV